MSMSWNLFQISGEIISRGASLMRVTAVWSVKSWSVDNTRLLPRAKILLVPVKIFLLQVDYALEGSTF